MFWAGINLLTTDQKPNFFFAYKQSLKVLATKTGLKIYMFYFFAPLLRFFFTYLLNWLNCQYLIVYLAQPFYFYPCTSSFECMYKW